MMSNCVICRVQQRLSKDKKKKNPKQNKKNGLFSQRAGKTGSDRFCCAFAPQLCSQPAALHKLTTYDKMTLQNHVSEEVQSRVSSTLCECYRSSACGIFAIVKAAQVRSRSWSKALPSSTDVFSERVIRIYSLEQRTNDSLSPVK